MSLQGVQCHGAMNLPLSLDMATGRNSICAVQYGTAYGGHVGRAVGMILHSREHKARRIERQARTESVAEVMQVFCPEHFSTSLPKSDDRAVLSAWKMASFLGAVAAAIAMAAVAIGSEMHLAGPFLLVLSGLLCHLITTGPKGDFWNPSMVLSLMLVVTYGVLGWVYQLKAVSDNECTISVEAFAVVSLALVCFSAGDMLGRTVIRCNGSSGSFKGARRLRLWLPLSGLLSVLVFALQARLAAGGLMAIIPRLHDRIRLFQGLAYLSMLSNVLAIGAIVLSMSVDIPWSSRAVGYVLGAIPIMLRGGRDAPLQIMMTLVVYSYLLKNTVPKARHIAAMVCAAGLLYTSYAFVFRLLVPGVSPQGFSFWRYSRDSILFAATGSLKELDSILKTVPLVFPHIYGRSFAGLLTMWIPRGLWADKPYGVGGMYSTVFYPVTYAQGTGTPPSFVGELFWNFSYVGVALGMLCLGVFMGILYRKQRRGGSRAAKAIYALTVAMLFPLIRNGSDTTVVFWLTGAVSILLTYHAVQI
ncbi:MAG TPA: hypothetical protein DDZ84_11680 [Firmicutes bacterium]|nr:hypothetical protein [Bacillota bacterium]